MAPVLRITKGNRTSALDVRYLRNRKTFARAERFRFLTHLELYNAERVSATQSR
jgi:hypothetical protein